MNDEERNNAIAAIPERQMWSLMMDQAKALVASGVLPDGVDRPATALAIIQTGREFGLKPMESFRNIHVIKGKTELSAGLMAAIVQNYCARHGGYMRQLELTDTSCTIEYKRAEWPEPQTFTFTMDDANKAGLIRGGGNWQKWPKQMLYARAVSNASKMGWPELMSGVYVDGEIEGPREPVIAAGDDGDISFDYDDTIQVVEAEAKVVDTPANPTTATTTSTTTTPSPSGTGKEPSSEDYPDEDDPELLNPALMQGPPIKTAERNALMKQLHAAAEARGGTHEDLREIAANMFEGFETMANLNEEQLQAILAQVQTVPVDEGKEEPEPTAPPPSDPADIITMARMVHQRYADYLTDLDSYLAGIQGVENVDELRNVTHNAIVTNLKGTDRLPGLYEQLNNAELDGLPVLRQAVLTLQSQDNGPLI